MARNLWISSEMQKRFEECTQKEDYGALRNCWKDVLWVPDEVKNVKLHNNHHAQFMAEEMGELINYLISYKPHYQWEVSARSREKFGYVSAMYEEIGLAILNKDWKRFLKRYSSTMDYIIREAREQKLIDFSIAHNGNWYNTLGSWYSAKNTSPSTLDLKPTILHLIITEHMIRSFKECTRKQDYKPFYNENRTFITDFDDALKNHFNYSNESSSYIKCLAQHVKSSFCYLTKLDAQNASAGIPGDYGISPEANHIRMKLERAFLKEDWSEFYQLFRFKIIKIIRVAREQKVLDLKIEIGEGKYERFEDWAETREASSPIFDHPFHPENGKNNGIMIWHGGDSSRFSRDISTLWYICCGGEKTRCPSPPVELGGPPTVFQDSIKSPLLRTAGFRKIIVNSEKTCDSAPASEDVLVEGFVNVPPQNRNTEIPNVNPIGPIEAERTTHELDTSEPSTDEVSPSAAPIEKRHFIDDSVDSSDTPSPFKRGSSSIRSMMKRQLETTKTNHIGTTDPLIEEESEDVDDYHLSEEFIAFKKKLDDAAKLRDTLNKVEEEAKLNIPADRPQTLSEGVTSSDDDSEGQEETSSTQEEEEEKIEMLENLDKSPNASSTIVGDSSHSENSKNTSTPVKHGGDSSNYSLDYSTISSFSWCAEEETPCPLQPDEPVEAPKADSKHIIQSPSSEPTKPISTVSDTSGSSRDDEQSENQGLAVGSCHIELSMDQGLAVPDHRRNEYTTPGAVESLTDPNRTTSMRSSSSNRSLRNELNRQETQHFPPPQSEMTWPSDSLSSIVLPEHCYKSPSWQPRVQSYGYHQNSQGNGTNLPPDPSPVHSHYSKPPSASNSQSSVKSDDYQTSQAPSLLRESSDKAAVASFQIEKRESYIAHGDVLVEGFVNVSTENWNSKATSHSDYSKSRSPQKLDSKENCGSPQHHIETNKPSASSPCTVPSGTHYNPAKLQSMVIPSEDLQVSQAPSQRVESSEEPMVASLGMENRESSPAVEDVTVEGSVDAPSENGPSNAQPLDPIEADGKTHVLDTSHPLLDPNKEGESADDPVDSSMMSMVMRQLEATKTNHLGKTDVLIEEEPEDVDDYQQSEQYIAFKERLEAAAKLRDDVKQVEEEAKLNISAERRPASSERVTSSDGRTEFEERLRAQKEQQAKEWREKKEERRRKQLERDEELRKAKENRSLI